MKKSKKVHRITLLFSIVMLLYINMNVFIVQAAIINYKYSYTLYGVELTPATVGEQKDRSCAKGATDVILLIFSAYPKEYSTSFECTYNILREKKAEERTLTAKHIEEYINAVPLGARIRICASKDTTSNYHDNSTNGHTQVLVDRTEEGFTVLECSIGTRMHATTYTWDGYVKQWAKGKGYKYIFYVMDFTAAIPEGYASASNDGTAGYSRFDYGLPCLIETYPAGNGEDENWPLTGSISCFYNQNEQMVLRYVCDDTGAPEEACVYVYGEHGPTEAYKYDCKRGIMHSDGTQEYLNLATASYTYNNEGELEKVRWHYDDFVDKSDMRYGAHDITYEFQYATTGECLSGDYIWNHYEDFYFPGNVSLVQIKIDHEGKLESIYGYEDERGSHNFTETPVVALDYTCDSKGNVNKVSCMTVSGSGSYSIEYELKDGHRQSAVQYDVFGDMTGRETYTYYPPEDMGNYMSPPMLQIDSVSETEDYGSTKTIVVYCDSQMLNNCTIKNTASWKEDLESMPMLKKACGF